jgi:hypothetical protein
VFWLTDPALGDVLAAAIKQRGVVVPIPGVMRAARNPAPRQPGAAASIPTAPGLCPRRHEVRR